MHDHKGRRGAFVQRVHTEFMEIGVVSHHGSLPKRRAGEWVPPNDVTLMVLGAFQVHPGVINFRCEECKTRPECKGFQASLG